jgi:hypothetical protein
VSYFDEPAQPEEPARSGRPRWLEFLRASAPLSAAAAVIGAFIYGVTLLPKAEFTAFDINAYREKLARKPGGESLRSIIARQIGADGLTPSGVAGWLDYEPSSGVLVMSIKDVRGNPVVGADVRAAMRRPTAPDGPNFMLVPDADKAYSAEIKSLGHGPWDVSITAVDPSVPSGTGLIFRVEKNITVR